MKDIVEIGVKFITDKTKSIPLRAMVVFLLLITLPLINNLTGYIYFNYEAKKLEQLKSITELLNDTTLQTNTVEKLRELETETINKKKLLDYLFISNDEKGINKNERNNFLFLLSSSGIYILSILAMGILLLFIDNETIIWTRKIVMFITFSFLVSLFVVFLYWLMGLLIPDKIHGNWNWNYLINLIAQILFIVGLYLPARIINNVSKKRNNKPKQS